MPQSCCESAKDVCEHNVATANNKRRFIALYHPLDEALDQQQINATTAAPTS